MTVKNHALLEVLNALENADLPPSTRSILSQYANATIPASDVIRTLELDSMDELDQQAVNRWIRQIEDAFVPDVPLPGPIPQVPRGRAHSIVAVDVPPARQSRSASVVSGRTRSPIRTRSRSRSGRSRSASSEDAQSIHINLPRFRKNARSVASSRSSSSSDFTHSTKSDDSAYSLSPERIRKKDDKSKKSRHCHVDKKKSTKKRTSRRNHQKRKKTRRSRRSPSSSSHSSSSSGSSSDSSGTQSSSGSEGQKRTKRTAFKYTLPKKVRAKLPFNPHKANIGKHWSKADVTYNTALYKRALADPKVFQEVYSFFLTLEKDVSQAHCYKILQSFSTDLSIIGQNLDISISGKTPSQIEESLNASARFRDNYFDWRQAFGILMVMLMRMMPWLVKYIEAYTAQMDNWWSDLQVKYEGRLHKGLARLQNTHRQIMIQLDNDPKLVIGGKSLFKKVKDLASEDISAYSFKPKQWIANSSSCTLFGPNHKPTKNPSHKEKDKGKKDEPQTRNRRYCIAYNKNECTRGADCKYFHLCARNQRTACSCNGIGPFITCPQNTGNNQANNNGQPANNAAPPRRGADNQARAHHAGEQRN